MNLLYCELVDYIESKIQSANSAHRSGQYAPTAVCLPAEKVIDQIAQVYQQLHMFSANHLS
ncbi:hypothetical protein [Sodalis-like endosymbiont of Proechinophthirus fluctus]|uniref:hypothetical protein n=1 Tax=Sodalis-like endosymbiont of Proechinophthirus fluctus TaxID=1462730 RepID=UPI000ABE3771